MCAESVETAVQMLPQISLCLAEKRQKIDRPLVIGSIRLGGLLFIIHTYKFVTLWRVHSASLQANSVERLGRSA